jgi:phage baseplate assembly protein W
MSITVNVPVTKFSDLNFSFTMNPLTHDVASKNNEEAIKQSVRNLVLTQPYESPFHPEISSPIYGLLFDNFTPTLSNLIERSVYQTLEQFEPRVELISVDVRELSDRNSISINIIFKIINTSRPIAIDVILERVR